MHAKKITKKLSFILFIMLFGGIGGIVIDYYIFPHLASNNFFSRYEFLKKSTENTTIINKTEQISLKEETSVGKIASQTASSVVGILSYPDLTLKDTLSKQKNPQIEPKKGTGVIATSDGLILTHISAINLEKSKYKVIASDGNLYDANLVGTDSFSNLAFFKINAGNLPVATFVNSDEEKAGEKIIALGYGSENFPYAYNSGLLSQIDSNFSISGKNMATSENLQGVFRMDFSLDKNFIGGPVADYSGQITGIVGSAKGETGDAFFILPSNRVKKVIEKAIRGEFSANPVLGIYYIPLTRDYAIQNGMNNQKGALIFSASGQRGLAIIANSSADKAGLQLGDIITKVNDDEIDEMQTLPDLLYQYKKGDKINLTILRAGQESVKEVQL
jgi:S1-C subfamily serine protease